MVTFSCAPFANDNRRLETARDFVCLRHVGASVIPKNNGNFQDFVKKDSRLRSSFI